jgi:hypothetical protein
MYPIAAAIPIPEKMSSFLCFFALSNRPPIISYFNYGQSEWEIIINHEYYNLSTGVFSLLKYHSSYQTQLNWFNSINNESYELSAELWIRS